MSDEKPKGLADYLLETYQQTGLSRRRFLRRIGLSIAGAGALLEALAKNSKGCGCGGCNFACNAVCNASCDVDTCDELNICPERNTCKNDNTCLKENNCTRINECQRIHTCVKTNMCTTNVCGTNACKYLANTCETNSCTLNGCYVDICTGDDWCAFNGCEAEDTHCIEDDFACGINWCTYE